MSKEGKCSGEMSVGIRPKGKVLHPIIPSDGGKVPVLMTDRVARLPHDTKNTAAC